MIFLPTQQTREQSSMPGKFANCTRQGNCSQESNVLWLTPGSPTANASSNPEIPLLAQRGSRSNCCSISPGRSKGLGRQNTGHLGSQSELSPGPDPQWWWTEGRGNSVPAGTLMALNYPNFQIQSPATNLIEGHKIDNLSKGEN